MRIVELNGGLGNQICQYIFSRYLKFIHGFEDVVIDNLSYYALIKRHNGYELDLFPNIQLSLLSNMFDQDVWDNMVKIYRFSKTQHQIPYIFRDNEMDLFLITDEYCHDNTGVLTNKCVFEGPHSATKTFDFHNLNNQVHSQSQKYDNTYYKGLWFNEVFGNNIKKQIEHELMFPKFEDKENIEYSELIDSCECSVGLHIRRGDFITCKKTIPNSRYAKAIKNFKFSQKKENNLNISFFIFSDDIQWCKENTKELGFTDIDNITFIEGNSIATRSYIDMKLMTYCDVLIHNAQSSFCFAAKMISKKNPKLISIV